MFESDACFMLTDSGNTVPGNMEHTRPARPPIIYRFATRYRANDIEFGFRGPYVIGTRSRIPKNCTNIVPDTGRERVEKT